MQDVCIIYANTTPFYIRNLNIWWLGNLQRHHGTDTLQYQGMRTCTEKKCTSLPWEQRWFSTIHGVHTYGELEGIPSPSVYRESLLIQVTMTSLDFSYLHAVIPSFTMDSVLSSQRGCCRGIARPCLYWSPSHSKGTNPAIINRFTIAILLSPYTIAYLSTFSHSALPRHRCIATSHLSQACSFLWFLF